MRNASSASFDGGMYFGGKNIPKTKCRNFRMEHLDKKGAGLSYPSPILFQNGLLDSRINMER